MRQPDDPGIDFTDRPAPKAGFSSKVVVASAFLAAALHSCAAESHEWYPSWCCSDRDCAPIPEQLVREVSGGFLVTIPPGAHPMWGREKPKPLSVQIPYRGMKMSPDNQWHICISSTGEVICFFGVIGGA